LTPVTGVPGGGIPQGASYGAYNSANSTLYINSYFLNDGLSATWLAQLLDTVAHEMGHANGWLSFPGHDDASGPGDVAYDKQVKCVTEKANDKFAELRRLSGCR
jgi:hypothetical protein